MYARDGAHHNAELLNYTMFNKDEAVEMQYSIDLDALCCNLLQYRRLSKIGSSLIVVNLISFEDVSITAMFSI